MTSVNVRKMPSISTKFLFAHAPNPVADLRNVNHTKLIFEVLLFLFIQTPFFKFLLIKVTKRIIVKIHIGICITLSSFSAPRIHNQFASRVYSLILLCLGFQPRVVKRFHKVLAKRRTRVLAHTLYNNCLELLKL